MRKFKDFINKKDFERAAIHYVNVAFRNESTKDMDKLIKNFSNRDKEIFDDCVRMTTGTFR